MAAYKQLVVTSSVVTAGRKRKCFHSQTHKISKGDICLEVRVGMAKKGYCRECAIRMVDQARGALDEIYDQLG